MVELSKGWAVGAYKILIPIKMLRITFMRIVMFKSFKTNIGRNVKIRSCMQFKAICISHVISGTLSWKNLPPRK